MVMNLFVHQHDARPHLKADDDMLTAACRRDGWNLTFKNQLPKSPDLNVRDLGLFHSIQALMYQKPPSTVMELIAAAAT